MSLSRYIGSIGGVQKVHAPTHVRDYCVEGAQEQSS
jgi:hypothetical protein